MNQHAGDGRARDLRCCGSEREFAVGFEDVIAVHQRDLYMASPPGGSGRVEFEAMVRKVDKIDSSWRD